MHRIYQYLFFVAALILASSAVMAGSRIGKEGAVNIVAAIPEVKLQGKQIREQSSGKSRGLFRMTEPKSIIEGKEYWVVDYYEDDDISSRYIRTFLVSVDDGGVLVRNTAEPPDDVQTLDEWRKSMRQEDEAGESTESDDQDALPDGWREPTTQEATLEGDQLRTRSENDFLSAQADFDGDGTEDVARLLVSTDGTKYALFALLGSGNKIQLDQKDVVLLKTMGVDVLSPKTYKTACGKGYVCEEGDPKVLHLKNPGLLYFKDESAQSVYFWPSSDSKPRRIWLSD